MQDDAQLQETFIFRLQGFMASSRPTRDTFTLTALNRRRLFTAKRARLAAGTFSASIRQASGKTSELRPVSYCSQSDDRGARTRIREGSIAEEWLFVMVHDGCVCFEHDSRGKPLCLAAWNIATFVAASSTRWKHLIKLQRSGTTAVERSTPQGRKGPGTVDRCQKDTSIRFVTFLRKAIARSYVILRLS